GEWHLVSDYGWIWRPTIYQVGWRPYYSGYWLWYPGGWTWISSEPWGWAPYHYGRWSWMSGFGWVWGPGGVYSGAWGSWAATPDFIGWCPLDYYNRPSFLNTGPDQMLVAQGGSGWNFLPLNRWGNRSLTRSILSADRVPHLESAVMSRFLPRFKTSEVR